MKDKSTKITAVILAGGNLPDNATPQLFSNFSGKTLFEYLADQIIKTGIKKIVVCTSTCSVDAIREKFGNQYHEAEIVYSCEKEPRGTGGALVHALPLLDDEELLVLNGDAYLACDISNFVTWFQGLDEADAGILLANVQNAENLGRVSFYDDNRIYKFEERNKFQAPGLINAGIYMLKKSLLQSLPEDAPSSLENDLFPRLVKESKIYGLPSIGPFVDVTSPNAEWAIRDYHQKRLLPRI